MWSILSQTGVVAPDLSLTTDCSSFLLGLSGGMWLAAGILIWAILQYSLEPQPTTGEEHYGQETAPLSAALREAASYREAQSRPRPLSISYRRSIAGRTSRA